MNKINRCLLFVLSIVYAHSATAGFLAGTLIKLGSTSRRIRYIPIEQLKQRKFICSYDLNDAIVERLVTQVIKKRVSKYIRIIVDDHQIDASCDQLFFSPFEYAWIPAQELAPGMCLLQGTDEYVIIDDVIEIDQEVDAYDITVQQYHNFYVSEYDIVVHNFVPVFTIGFVWAIGGGIELSSIYGAVAATGVILGGLLSKNRAQELNQSLPANQYISESIVGYQPSYSNKPINLTPIILTQSSDIQTSVIPNNYPFDCFNRPTDCQSSLTVQPKPELCADDVLMLTGKDIHRKPKQEIPRSASASGDPNDDDPRNYNKPSEKHSNKENESKTPNQIDEEKANKLGFTRDRNPPFKTHGTPAFKKGNKWITRDRTSHKGGRWKVFDQKGNRIGTFDENLNYIAK